MTDTQTLGVIADALKTMVERDRQERAEHIGDIKAMNRAIEALTESNKEVNASINKLLANDERRQTQVDMLRELVTAKFDESASRQDSLHIRVESLEKHHYQSLGERAASEKQGRFWSDNWHKMFLVAIVVVNIVIWAVTRK